MIQNNKKNHLHLGLVNKNGILDFYEATVKIAMFLGEMTIEKEVPHVIKNTLLKKKDTPYQWEFKLSLGAQRIHTVKVYATLNDGTYNSKVIDSYSYDTILSKATTPNVKAVLADYIKNIKKGSKT